MSQQDWKKFEEATHEAIKEAHPTSKVYSGVYIQGKLSKVKREVDIQLVEAESYDFISIECKDHNRPVDVPVIEAYNTKLSDIGAKKGAIVSNSGYTKAAVNMAGELGIELLSLVDTENPKVRTRLFATTLVTDIKCLGFRIALEGISSSNCPVSEEPKAFIIRSGSEKMLASEYFRKLWNLGRLDHSAARHEYNFTQEIDLIGTDNQPVLFEKGIFIYDVDEEFYLGEIQIIETKGLLDVKEGSFRTKSILTEPLVPYEFEKVSRKISNEKAREANFTFGVTVVSMYDIVPSS